MNQAEAGPIPSHRVVGRLREACRDSWQAYTAHAFVRQISDGSLPHACFRHFLIQDYLFLVQFTRAYALAVYKSDNLDDMREAAAAVNALLNTEMGLHVQYCEQWGLTEQQMLDTPEAAATTSYTRYVLDAGMRGDLLDLLVALAPCSCGYGEIGARLIADPSTVLEGNPYREWIELYGGQAFQDVSRSAVDQIERVATARIGDRPWESRRWPALCGTFERAVDLETAFWQMGLDQAS
jgi:thiaminase/transcriptional activator TenA